MLRIRSVTLEACDFCRMMVYRSHPLVIDLLERFIQTVVLHNDRN